MSKSKYLKSLSAFESAARVAIPKEQWEWVVGAAELGRTMERNRDQFRDFYLRTRVLSGIDKVLCDSRFLGVATRTPIVVAPLGHMTQFTPDGELEIVRAASRAGAHSVVSMHTRRSLEILSRAVGDSGWSYQVYLYSDPEVVLSQVTRAVSLGASSTVVTVANSHRSPSYGRQEDPWDARLKGDRDEPLLPEARDDRLWTWSMLESLIASVKCPIVVKGIQTTEDACKAIAANAAGIWISNHGGRVTETDQSLLKELAEIRTVVGPHHPITIDGGFRTGSDVVKALLLGASNVAVGRPLIHGAIVDGEQGIFDVLEILVVETALVLGSLGIESVLSAPGHRAQVASTR